MAEKSFWDTEEEFASIDKGIKGEKIRVVLASKNQRIYIDVRTFYPDPRTGDLLPGKGIAIPIENAEEVAMAILEAAKE